MQRARRFLLVIVLLALLGGTYLIVRMQSSLTAHDGKLVKMWGPFSVRTIAEDGHFVEAKGVGRRAFLTYPSVLGDTLSQSLDVWVCSADGIIIKRMHFEGQLFDSATSMVRAQWSGENSLVAEGHINPTTSRYFVVSVRDGAISGYTGSEFALSPDGNTAAYVQRPAHFSPNARDCRLLVGHKVLIAMTEPPNSSATIYWAEDSSSFVVVFSSPSERRSFVASVNQQGEWQGQLYLLGGIQP